MVEIISVRFKEGGKQYYFNPNGERFRLGEGVIVETARGVEFGECTQENTAVDEMELTAPLRPVLRRATPEDQLTREKNKEKEARAFQICQEKIAEHGLEMKLVEAEYSFEGNKVLFFFTAEGRVDFRALVKDLASAIHARIELRQIGVRDEAKMLGHAYSGVGGLGDDHALRHLCRGNSERRRHAHGRTGGFRHRLSRRGHDHARGRQRQRPDDGGVAVGGGVHRPCRRRGVLCRRGRRACDHHDHSPNTGHPRRMIPRSMIIVIFPTDR